MTFAFKRNGVTFATKKVAVNSSGVAVAEGKALKKGKYTVVTTYRGATNFLPSKAKAMKLV